MAPVPLTLSNLMGCMRPTALGAHMSEKFA